LIVRTVLGDVEPETLGVTLAHEHVFANPPDFVDDPDLRLDDEQRSLAELERFREAGGGTVVDMTTRDYGNDAAVLARVSRASGVHVIAATGFNKGKFADRLSAAMGTDEIAGWMISEVVQGIGDTGSRAGLIKAASGLDGPGAHERRVFEAAAGAHLATGAPISTHTERGTWADGQVDLLTRLGVVPANILIGHLDHKPDLGYLRAVAQTGVYMGFDQFSKSKYLPDAERISLIAQLVEDGHGDRIVVSGDLARRSYLSAWGGSPGYRFFLGELPAAFAAGGLDGSVYRRLVGDNPRRFLSFEPVASE
jgi:5-phospho-D-xylono-1,4-lactonase